MRTILLLVFLTLCFSLVCQSQVSNKDLGIFNGFMVDNPKDIIRQTALPLSFSDSLDKSQNEFEEKFSFLDVNLISNLNEPSAKPI